MTTSMNIRVRSKQSGVTLVELMIALLLGLVLSAAIIQIFISSKNVYRLQADLARIQENGRFAVDLLSRDIRMAGYSGCGNIERLQVNVIAENADDWRVLNNSNFIRGVNDAAAGNAVGAKAGTDFIHIRSAAGAGVRLYPETVANSNIKIEGNPMGFKQDDVIMVSDCVNADVFSIVGISSSNSKVTISHSQANNTSNRLSKLYGSDAEVMFYQMLTYFIKPSGRQSAAGRNIDSLWLRIHGANVASAASPYVDVEVVEGVENLQIEYGVDTTGDRTADVFRSANQLTTDADWSRVVSTKLRLLLVGHGDATVSSSGNFAQTITYNGSSVTSDGVLRDVFENVVAIRNRLP